MTRRINALRWRLARLFAPDPILAEPSGDEKAYLLIRDGEVRLWIPAKTLDLRIEMDVPSLGDEFGLGTCQPATTGTFSGTVGA